MVTTSLGSNSLTTTVGAAGLDIRSLFFWVGSFSLCAGLFGGFLMGFGVGVDVVVAATFLALIAFIASGVNLKEADLSFLDGPGM